MYFYPRPPRGGRPDLPVDCHGSRDISIHALREEGDPHIKGDKIWTRKFLSTPSARRATSRAARTDGILHDFYPRPPRGGRRRPCGQLSLFNVISIHALREEGDTSTRNVKNEKTGFLSTPSARRATSGDRPQKLSMIFLSTPSARRATLSVASGQLVDVISIHALREEGDCRWRSLSAQKGYFYPRPPRGGRPRHQHRRPAGLKISIHALREEGDRGSGRGG